MSNAAEHADTRAAEYAEPVGELERGMWNS
jgi:hypothetical protein